MTMMGAVMLMATVVPASAQVDDAAMEAQRCIWRCLHDSPGADSTEYHSCVARQCSDEFEGGEGMEPAAATPVLAAPPWASGATSDGGGRFAGVTDPGLGNSLYVMCAATGARFLALQGPEGPDATLSLMIDAVPYPMFFQDQGGMYYAALGAAELAALAQAAEIAILNTEGHTLLALRMNGAAGALAAACP